MNQAEVDCLAANAYIELALRAAHRSRWQHYATKAEVHSLRARQNRAEGYVRSRVFDEIRLAKVRLAQREPAESAAVGTTPSTSPRTPGPRSSSTGSPGSAAT